MLTIFHSLFQDIMLMQTSWAAQLNPLLNNPLNSAIIIKDVVLVTGDNVINHKLGKTQQGWFLVDAQSTPSGIYRSQPFNSLTLTLNAPAGVTVSIGVF